MFYQSVMASVLFYVAVCWGGNMSKRDTGRLDRLVRKAGSVVGQSLDSLGTGDTETGQALGHHAMQAMSIIPSTMSWQDSPAASVVGGSTRVRIMGGFDPPLIKTWTPPKRGQNDRSGGSIHALEKKLTPPIFIFLIRTLGSTPYVLGLSVLGGPLSQLYITLICDFTQFCTIHLQYTYTSYLHCI